MWDTSTYSYNELREPPLGGISPETVEEKSLNFAGYPAIEYMYTYVGDNNSGSVLARKVSFVKNNLIYLIECGEANCEKILSTFKFIEPIDISTWQTYCNEEYGFEFRYPSDEKIVMGDYGTPGGGEKFDVDLLKEGNKILSILVVSSGVADGVYTLMGPHYITKEIVIGQTVGHQLTKKNKIDDPVRIAVSHGDNIYDFYFYGVDSISDQNSDILSTFKFIE